MKTIKTYAKANGTGKKKLVGRCNVTKKGTVTTKSTGNIMEVYKERRNVKYVLLYGKGKKGQYVSNSLKLDRPFNQLTAKQLRQRVSEVQFTMNAYGELVMKAVVA